MKIYRNSEQLALFDKIVGSVLLKKTQPTKTHCYSEFVKSHRVQGLIGDPISYDTFCRWCRDMVSEKEYVVRREGRAALRELTQTKTGSFFHEGFSVRCEADGFHEPIWLLSSMNMKPLANKPVHIFAVEASVPCVLGIASDYRSGSEYAHNVIECYKQAMLPKSHFIEKFGLKSTVLPYGKPGIIIHDAGSAFNAASVDEFLDVAFIDSGLTRTKMPSDKPWVESTIKVVKGYLRNLPGSYNDNQKSEASNKKNPVLTDMEHQIILNRLIFNNFHDSRSQRSKKSISRIEHWRQESLIFPPVLPKKLQVVAGWLPVSDIKKIQQKVGIQIQRDHLRFTYNSEELQDFRQKMSKSMGSRWDGTAALKMSFSNAIKIRVFNPDTNRFFEVPRVEESRINVDRLSGLDGYLMGFVKEQKMEDLLPKTL